MKTTFKIIKSNNPCIEGWKKLIGHYNPVNLNETITIKEIINSNGIKDAVWALRCINEYVELKKIHLFCADIAESVLPIFEKKYPGNNSPRKAIEATRLFVNGKIELRQLKAAYAAAYAAAYSASASAASAAASAADAAASAADATASAADAAASAADAAASAYSAADAAAYAAASAADAYSAADAAEKWIEITKLLMKYLNKK